jgi:hypothetical protein
MRKSIVLLFVAACGTDAATGDDMPPDAGDGYALLVKGDWQLAAGTEDYRCVRLTVNSDIYVKSIRPIAPIGTHHTVLMLGDPDAMDGNVECSSSLIKPAIYASGVGTQQLDFPDGVALHIRPGQQLLLNLHLFNASDAALSGTSGIEFLPANASDVVHEAGVALAGKTDGLTVPIGPSTQTGTCTTPGGLTAFAMAPHMHLLGTHMTVTLNHAGTTQTLLDVPYTFDNQLFHSLTPQVVTAAGDQIQVACSYMNTTNNVVTFGESTTNEMCFAMTYVYPAPAKPTCTR